MLGVAYDATCDDVVNVSADPLQPGRRIARPLGGQRDNGVGLERIPSRRQGHVMLDGLLAES